MCQGGGGSKKFQVRPSPTFLNGVALSATGVKYKNNTGHSVYCLIGTAVSQAFSSLSRQSDNLQTSFKHRHKALTFSLATAGVVSYINPY